MFQPNQTDGGLAQVRQDTAVQGAFLTQAFFWMFAGLLLTAAVSAAVLLSQAFYDLAASLVLPIIIAQLALVVVISWGIRRLNATLALGLFFIYSASVGLTVGLIVSIYTSASVTTAFLTASAMFGAAGLYGYTTKRSLASIGGLATMALFGLVAAIVVNLFVGSNTFGYIISIVGVVVFTLLTAWDVQRISAGQLVTALGSVEKAAVIGALNLYLDFVNLFLFLLRLLGGRR
jgi:uncharacterized protein